MSQDVFPKYDDLIRELGTAERPDLRDNICTEAALLTASDAPRAAGAPKHIGMPRPASKAVMS
ncbi:hypothetical protein KCG44_12120 [Pacificimonas sp. WHA3]|uniref:Uncharacterized protein n=1 Tax=Pacificimonas pallii TaxID=2827236 RepID=A0ABS6SHX7_9SPHN|nr:hypothetical protein [Pacificimonas pallii]MBV7257531.1 hypothetical protein [Pacificimonas pallii]